jgi:hypothetical protein
MTQDPLWSPLVSSDAERHVVAVVVCAEVTPQGAPTNPTREFRTGQRVYLVCAIEGITAGERHQLSVRWLLDGRLVPVAGAHSSALVMENGGMSFSIAYPSQGAGAARVYWDEPVGDNNDFPNDTFLAQTSSFTIRKDANHP